MNDEHMLADQRSEFEEIVNKFQVELEKMGENSNLILSKVSMFREFRESVNSSENSSKSEKLRLDGVIGKLVELLQIMCQHNEELAEARRGLTKFVG